MSAFKRCDACGRTVEWTDIQERHTWLEVRWDSLDDDAPEQVWDFCSWECLVAYGVARRRAPAAEAFRELGDRLASTGTSEDEVIAALEAEHERRSARRSAAQRDVRLLIEEIERGSRGEGAD